MQLYVQNLLFVQELLRRQIQYLLHLKLCTLTWKIGGML